MPPVVVESQVHGLDELNVKDQRKLVVVFVVFVVALAPAAAAAGLLESFVGEADQFVLQKPV